MTLNLDLIIMGILFLLIFYISMKYVNLTLDKLARMVENLSDKVMARDFSEITRITAIKEQSEISKAAIAKQPNVIDPKSLDEKIIDEKEQVL